MAVIFPLLVNPLPTSMMQERTEKWAGRVKNATKPVDAAVNPVNFVNGIVQDSLGSGCARYVQPPSTEVKGEAGAGPVAPVGPVSPVRPVRPVAPAAPCRPRHSG